MEKTHQKSRRKTAETETVTGIKRVFTRRRRGTFWIALAAVLALCFVLEQAGVWDRLLGLLGTDPITAPPDPNTLEVHYLSVGNADAALLMCNGAAMLIDGGELDDGDMLVRHIRACGVNTLDLVIATHGDSDHIGGLLTVMDRLPVGRFLLSYMPEGAEPTTSAYLALLEKVADKGIPTVDAVPGALYSLGAAQVEILGPVAASPDTNEQSVICRVTYGKNRFLFTGDAGEEEENSLLAAGADLKAEVLKVGHHGSAGSTAEAFLQAVGARYGVISCGADNPYGHPHKAVLSRLEKAGVTLYRTDQNGTVVMISDGQDISIRTER